MPKTRIPEILRAWTEGEGLSGRTLAKFVSPFRDSATRRIVGNIHVTASIDIPRSRYIIDIDH